MRKIRLRRLIFHEKTGVVCEKLKAHIERVILFYSILKILFDKINPEIT